MAHELFKLQAKLSNRPQLMALPDFESINKYLSGSANREVRKVELSDEDERMNSRYQVSEEFSAAQFVIEGPMTYRPVTVMGMDCGGFSYQQFKADFKAVINSGVKTVAFLVDSPGGEAHQAFASAEYVRKLADENGVKIISYVDGISASAGYVWTAISDEVIAAPSSELGSIGVVVRLYNDSKKLEQEGYERIFITAGADKVPYENDGKFKQSFLDGIQDKVIATYQDFVSHVSKYRGISEETVRSTEANMYRAEEAVALGLADKIMKVEDFQDYFTEVALSRIENKEEPMKPAITDMFKLNKGKPDMKLEELQATLDAKEAEMSALATQFSELTAQMESLQAALGEKEAALSEALAKAKAAEEQAALQAKEAKLKDRQAALFAAGLSEEDAKSQAASLEALDDATFETVRAAFAKQYAAVQGSDLFQQQSAAATEVAVEKTKTAAEAAVEATRKAMKDRGI